MRQSCFVFFLFVLASLVGCAKMPTHYDYYKADTPPVIEPDETSSVVCFVREDAFVGSGISYFINEGEKRIGLLRSGSYFMTKTTPGDHTYWAETEAKTFITVNAKANTTMYVVGGVGMGMWAGRPILQAADEASAKHLIVDDELEYLVMRPEEEAKALKQADKQKEEEEKLYN